MTDSNTFAVVAAFLHIAVDSAYRGKQGGPDTEKARSECIKYMRRAAGEFGYILIEPAEPAPVDSAADCRAEDGDMTMGR